MPDNENDPLGIVRPVLSVPGPENKARGGMHFHKDPDCKCLPCTSRRRKEEALLEPAGTGGSELAPIDEDETEAVDQVIDADHPLVVHTLPKRSRGVIRQYVANWIRMKAVEPDITVQEAAKRMNLSRNGLQVCLTRATREGWLRFEDPLARIEYELIPKVVRNLNEFLDERDKTVTIETAKGTVFKTYQEDKGISQAPTTILALKLELPEGDAQIVTGKIVSKPRIIEVDPDAVG